MKKGLTLIELIMVIVLFVVLAAVVVYILRAVLLSWSSQETRPGIDISLDRGIEEVVRDLREAKAVQSSNDEIRFTDFSDNNYIFYFYNDSDPYPPQFNQSSYELRKAALTTLTGSLVDSGRIMITDVVPPTTSDLSEDPDDTNVYIIDLTVTRGDEIIKSRTQVRPRNL